jgi:hypothetical protein
MKYVDEYRDPVLIANVAREIARSVDRDRRFGFDRAIGA